MEQMGNSTHSLPDGFMLPTKSYRNLFGSSHSTVPPSSSSSSWVNNLAVWGKPWKSIKTLNYSLSYCSALYNCKIIPPHVTLSIWYLFVICDHFAPWCNGLYGWYPCQLYNYRINANTWICKIATLYQRNMTVRWSYFCSRTRTWKSECRLKSASNKQTNKQTSCLFTGTLIQSFMIYIHKYFPKIGIVICEYYWQCHEM